MRLASLTLVVCAVAGAQPSSFEGVAIHALTRQPLNGVHVRLIGVNRTDSGAEAETYGAMSDRAGHFSIGGVKAGAYMLMPEYRGFVYTQPRSGVLGYPNVTLKAGAPVSGFTLAMTPRAGIVGRVTDENGDPVNATVRAEPVAKDIAVAYPAMYERLVSQTDDRGMFQISGAPGKYYVKAELISSGTAPAVEIRTDGSRAVQYGATYYPSAESKDGAAPVEAVAGADVTGIEIRLRPGHREKYKVNGTVLGLAQPNSGARVVLQRIESGRVVDTQSTMAGQDGRFAFQALDAGNYRAEAAAYGAGRSQSRPVEFRLDQDQVSLSLRLEAAGEISGTVEAAGSSRPRAVLLRPVSDFADGPELRGAVAADGAFRIAEVPDGRYRVRVEPQVDDAYFLVQVDNKPSRGSEVELARGAKLKVSVKSSAGQISGSLLSSEGEKVVGTLGLVVLVEDPAKVDLDHGEWMAPVSADGTYKLKAIRPGKYRILGIDALRGPDFNEPDVVKKMAAEAEEVEIREGDRIAKDVRVAARK